LQIYKNEILREIKSELAARYIGMEGRLKEQLNSDPQVQTAIEIVNNQKNYDQLLNIK